MQFELHSVVVAQFRFLQTTRSPGDRVHASRLTEPDKSHKRVEYCNVRHIILQCQQCLFQAWFARGGQSMSDEGVLPEFGSLRQRYVHELPETYIDAEMPSHVLYFSFVRRM